MVYGTTNLGKLSYMRRHLCTLPVELIGLRELPNLPAIAIDESGCDPLENAVIKAKAYYAVLHQPVCAADSGLYCEELPNALQPGVHVRRVGGKSLNDEEMIAYYASLAERYGTLTARYRNGICLVMDDTHCYPLMNDSLSGHSFGIVAKPHPLRVPGFPLDSLSISLQTGGYYLDAAQLPADEIIEQNAYSRFFREALEQYEGQVHP
ncbi:MAG: non-canonical purine NTP pyrophosphatase [Clostridia bacterium]